MKHLLIALTVALVLPAMASAQPRIEIDPDAVTVRTSDPAGAPVEFTVHAYHVRQNQSPQPRSFTCDEGLTGSGTKSFIVRFPVGLTRFRCWIGDGTPEDFMSVDVAFVAPAPPPPPPPPPAPTPPPQPTPPAAPRPDTPPANVASLSVRARSGSVAVTWTLPGDADLDRVEVARATAGAVKRIVYSGVGTAFVDRTVRPGRTYTYTVTSVDAAGNRSGGIARKVTTPMLMAFGASPPVLRWTPVSSATYYNVQVWRNGKKILSAWPGSPRYAVSARWTFRGVLYRLTAGTYRWYVWPGLGSRSAARYGKLLGSSTFVVRH